MPFERVPMLRIFILRMLYCCCQWVRKGEEEMELLMFLRKIPGLG